MRHAAVHRARERMFSTRAFQYVLVRLDAGTAHLFTACACMALDYLAVHGLLLRTRVPLRRSDTFVKPNNAYNALVYMHVPQQINAYPL